MSSRVKDIFDRWLKAHKIIVGKHPLWLLTESDRPEKHLFKELRGLIRNHFVAPAVLAKWYRKFGAPKTAALLRDHLPTTKTARSGDLGEVFATEIAERHLAYQVPIRRLRYKDGREMALRGNDIIAVKHGDKNRLEILKGEAKSRVSLTTDVIKEAGDALDRDRGRPSRHSVLFIADRLREQNQDDLAGELENAVLQSFRRCGVEHYIFTLTGSDPQKLLSNYLKACARKPVRRHIVGIYIRRHSKFIRDLFSSM